MRYEALAGFFIKIRKVYARLFGMTRKVIVGPIREAVEFVASEWEIKIEIDCALRVVRTVFRCDIYLMHGACINADVAYPRMHLLAPVLKLFFPFLFSNKILELHQIKLAYAEEEIARRNLIPKCLSRLCDTER